MNNSGGTVTKIKKLIETVSFALKFNLITKHTNKEHEFNSDPIRHLMKDCDNEARKVIETINSKSEESSMCMFG